MFVHFQDVYLFIYLLSMSSSGPVWYVSYITGTTQVLIRPSVFFPSLLHLLRDEWTDVFPKVCVHPNENGYARPTNMAASCAVLPKPLLFGHAICKLARSLRQRACRVQRAHLSGQN